MGDLADIMRRWEEVNKYLDGGPLMSTSWIHSTIFKELLSPIEPTKKSEPRKCLFGIHKSGKNGTWGEYKIKGLTGITGPLGMQGVSGITGPIGVIGDNAPRVNPETGEINVKYSYASLREHNKW
jgi:hypothetical protein